MVEAQDWCQGAGRQFGGFGNMQKVYKVYTMLRSASLQDVLILGPRRVCVWAQEKIILVLVVFSKNMFTIVLPLRRIAFLLSVWSISLNLNEVSIILFKSETGKCSRPIRCLLLSI